MTFRHIGEILNTVIPERLAQACSLIGVEPTQVPNDGNWHPVRLLNDAANTFNGKIKIQTDHLCGVVCNIKTGKTQTFTARANLAFNGKKSAPNKKPQKYNNTLGIAYLKLIKHRLTKEVQL